MKTRKIVTSVIVILTFVVTNIQAQTLPSYIPSNGLVGYWGFDGNPNDISGNGNNGTVNAALLSVDRYEQINSAYNFIEQSNIVVQNNSPLGLNNTDFTINSWIKLDAFPSLGSSSEQYNQYYTILGKRQYGASQNNYSIGISTPSAQNGAGNLVFAQGPAGVGSFVTSSSPIGAGVWNNISIVYTQSNQTIKLFVNNSLVIQQTGVTIPGENTANLWFGNDVSGYANYFPGTIDDIGIWNRALTQQELNSVYNSNTNCLLPTPSIAASGSTTLCQGESVLLTSSSPSGNTWSNGATTQSITVTDSGSYSVTFSNESCYKTSNPVVVTVNQLPTDITVTASGPTSFCAGGTVSLSLNNIASIRYLKFESYYSSDNGQVNVQEIRAFSNGVNVALNKTGYANSYESRGNWSSNGKNAVDGSSGSRWSSNRNDLGPDVTNPHYIVIDLESQYNIESVLLELSNFQQTFSFKVSQDGANWVEIGSGNAASGNFTFSPPTTNFSDYLWSTGETTQSIIVSNSGSYSVKAFIGASCFVLSNTVVVTVAPLSTTSAIRMVPAATIVIPSVTIGTQTWTSKNLDVSTYRDGTPIPQVTDPTAWANLTTGAWCYYNNDPANGVIYGKLYNWYAVAGIHDNDPNTPNKVLGQTGWHVPSDGEWTTLTDYLGGVSVAGNKMKELGTTHWNSNSGATNSSGFTALPGGFRNAYGLFSYIGNVGYWWSTAELRFLSLDFNAVNAFRGNLDNTFGFSVRLIKD